MRKKILINHLSKQVAKATGLNNNGSIRNEYVMGQNESNPFTTETTIKYNIPTSSQKNVLSLYDLNGKKIKNIEVLEKGESSIKITSSMLSDCIYIYTLIVDGKVIDSKKMIISE